MKKKLKKYGDIKTQEHLCLLIKQKMKNNNNKKNIYNKTLIIIKIMNHLNTIKFGYSYTKFLILYMMIKSNK